MSPSLHRPSVIIASSREEAAQAVADVFAQTIAQTNALKSQVILGLATGSTPIPVYAELVKRHQAGDLSLANATTFNLDEYLSLGGNHPQSFRAFMDEQLFRLVDIDPSNIHIPDGLTQDAEAHCQAYEAAIEAAGGLDVQLLGIGSNGHIAFNEPGSSPDSGTRVVELTEKTIQDNSRFFDRRDQVPRRAISMGIGTILRAKKIVLLATGESKAQAVAAAIDGRPDASCPASWLQRHSDVTFVLDAEASKQLTDVS